MNEQKAKFQIFCALLSQSKTFSREDIIIETSNRYSDFEQAWGSSEPAVEQSEPSDKTETCTWTPNDLYETWESDCGLEWAIPNDSDPKENGMEFCPKCGKPLVVGEQKGI